MATRNHNPVDASYLADDTVGPHAKYFLPFPRRVVWNALLDAKAWTQWLPIDRAEWTSPAPFGVGTTRTVVIGSNNVEETFIVWEEAERMAFRFDRSEFPVREGVEDYRLIDAPGGCEIQWTCRMDPIFPRGHILKMQMQFGFPLMFPRLKKLIASDTARFEG